MDITKLLGLRPKMQTSEAIGAAITQAEAERAEALTRIDELTAGRGALLLTGDEKAVEAGERELAELRAQAERLGVMVEALKPTLRQAKMQEKVAEIRALSEEAEKDTAAFTAWWQKRYAGLAQELRDGLLLERKAEQTLRQLGEAAADMEAFQASGVAMPARPIDRIYLAGQNPTLAVGSMVRLPPASGQPSRDASNYIWFQGQ
jgi:hypothetical protein